MLDPYLRWIYGGDNAIFTLSQLYSKSLDEMIVTLVAKEKTMKTSDIEDSSHPQMTLFSKGRK